MANNSEEEQENGVTYFVDEKGQYYFQPAAAGRGPNVKLNNINVDQDKSEVFIYEEEEIGDSAPEEELDQPPKKKVRAQRAVFTCDFCAYTCHRRFLISRHLTKHSEKRAHKCGVCERGFKTAASLKHHINVHNRVKPNACKYCDSRFTTSGELIRHVRYKHTHEKPYKCTDCNYAAVELSRLRKHISIHTARQFQCQHCTYTSPYLFKLKRHLSAHTGEKPYKCDMCNMCFTQSNSLIAHQLIHDASKKPVYQCELCPMKCSRKIDLRIHIEKLHTLDKLLECNQCGKSFPDRYSYKVHNKTHAGEKSLKCQFCPYESTTCHHLEIHLLKHPHGKPFSCDLCDQSFRQKQLLHRHHDLYHNPDYIPKTHSCHECNRTFVNKGNLIRHLASHNDDPDSGHQERTLALKLGRQKDKYIATEKLKNTKAKPKGMESVMVSERSKEKYVVPARLLDYHPQEDDKKEEDDNNNDGENEIILLEVKKPMLTERSINLRGS